MYRKLSQIAFFTSLLLFCIAGIGKSASSTDLEGSWRNIRQAGFDAIFISFGADGDFYMESKSFWYLGSYKLENKDETRRLILYVEDGSDAERIGERIVYSFELNEETLTLETSPTPGILERQNANGRAVYIVISNDSDEDDEDDDEFSIYASCFINMTRQTDIACCTSSKI